MGYVYILLCEDKSYYTGSTIDINRRFSEHLNGHGAHHTRKHPPICIVYLEEFSSIKKAFEREKQIQGWSRKKKEALINGLEDVLKKAAECMNETHWKNRHLDSVVSEPVELLND